MHCKIAFYVKRITTVTKSIKNFESLSSTDERNVEEDTKILIIFKRNEIKKLYESSAI